MRILGYALRAIAVILLLPICLVAGMLLSSPFFYGWRSAEPDELPPMAAVAAVIRAESIPHCRLVSIDDLDRLREILSVRLNLTEDDLAGCRESFANYSTNRRWDVSLSGDENRALFATLQIDRTRRGPRFSVHQGFGESSLTLRYRVDSEEAPVDVRYRASSMGHGVAVVGLGGIAGLVLWVVTLLFLVRHWIRAGREPDELALPSNSA